MIIETDRLPAETSVSLTFNIKLIAALNEMTKFLKGGNSLKGFDLLFCPRFCREATRLEFH